MSALEMTLDQAVKHLAKGSRAFEAAEYFESRVHAFREASIEGDADAVNSAAAILVEDIWNPEGTPLARQAIFEFSRAMNEAVSPAIRMVLQHHQAYALEALAGRVLEIETGGDDDGSGDGSAQDGEGGGSAPQPSTEPLQPAA